MDELATKLVDSLTKIENVLETMAPTAFQALVEAAVLAGAVILIWTAIEVFLVAGGIILVRNGLKLVTDDTTEWEIIGGAMIVCGGLLSVFSALCILYNLSHEDTWLRVLNPTAYVIKSLLYPGG